MKTTVRLGNTDFPVSHIIGKPEFIFDATAGLSLAGKSVLVTGAGGSIGSLLCRHLLRQNEANHICCLGRGEQSLMRLKMELEVITAENDIDTTFSIALADIQSYPKMAMTIDDSGVDTIIHTAAHKFLPILESFPEEAVANNVVGTINLCVLAAKYGVKSFVLISTDKAVNPTSVLGATKQLAERVILYPSSSQSAKNTTERERLRQIFGEDAPMRTMVVRFGNVANSNGSAIPVFAEQINTNQPIKLSDPLVKRHFIQPMEAVELILRTIDYGEHNKIHSYGLGEPVLIREIIDRMIALHSSYEGDVQVIGLALAEKMVEEVLSAQEKMATIVKGNRLLVSTPSYPSGVKGIGDLIAAAGKMYRPLVRKYLSELTGIKTPNYTSVVV